MARAANPCHQPQTPAPVQSRALLGTSSRKEGSPWKASREQAAAKDRGRSSLPGGSVRRPGKGLLSAVLLLAACSLMAEEPAVPPGTVRITPEKVEQLKRMQPLNREKLAVYMEAGQLTQAQYLLVLGSLTPEGRLNLNPIHLGAEGSPADTPSRPAQAQADPAQAGLPRRGSGALDPAAYIRQLDQQDAAAAPRGSEEGLRERVLAFRSADHGTRLDIQQELKAAGARANSVVAGEYPEPIDFFLKAALWSAVANRRNPAAAGYIAHTHQQLVNEAHPVLIPYAKDIGGMIFRRRSGKLHPLQQWYSSRDLRDLIVNLEGYIARCSGIRSVSYLMDVYAARYEADEAPMRDKDRDRERIVQACGGDKRDFDQDKPQEWKCALASSVERAMIAERLVPHLRSDSGSVRHIATNGLQVVLGLQDKKLKNRLEDAHKNWDEFYEWWSARREVLLAGRERE